MHFLLCLGIMRTCVCMYVYIYVVMCIYIYISLYTWSIFVFTHKYTHYVCIYIIYIYTYYIMCIYIYIYTQLNLDTNQKPAVLPSKCWPFQTSSRKRPSPSYRFEQPHRGPYMLCPNAPQVLDVSMLKETHVTNKTETRCQDVSTLVTENVNVSD